MVEIRPATQNDLEGLNDIYNFYVRNSPATFDVDEVTLDRRKEWFSHYAETGPHRVFVAVSDGRITGWASSSSLHERKAYGTSTVTTVYVADDCRGQGVGKRLYEALFAAIDGEDLHRAYAGITMPNDASVGLHESFGFRRVAYYSEQGRKFDRYWDVAWFEKEL